MPRCAACGRLLRRPSQTGLGPVCARRLNPAPARRPVVRTPDIPPDPIPGQEEIPLRPMQPSLWAL